jgi:hypothetical protein
MNQPPRRQQMKTCNWHNITTTTIIITTAIGLGSW